MSKPPSANARRSVHTTATWCYALQVVLLGDAAHTMTPILGQGLNCGIEDVQVFANTLQLHEGNVEATLPAYHRARWPDVEAILNVNEIMARSGYTVVSKVILSLPLC